MDPGDAAPKRATDLLSECLSREGCACPRCGYDLSSMTSPTCPECGWGLRLRVDEGSAAEAAVRGARRLAWVGVLFSLPGIIDFVAAAVAFGPSGLLWGSGIYLIMLACRFALLAASVGTLIACRTRRVAPAFVTTRRAAIAARVVLWTAVVTVLIPQVLSLGFGLLWGY